MINKNPAWLDWTPTVRTLADSPKNEPTKPTKPVPVLESCGEAKDSNQQNHRNLPGEDEVDNEAVLANAVRFLNASGIRIVRLPLGEAALQYPPGTDLGTIYWAMMVLHIDAMPLVIADAGRGWTTWAAWMLSRRVQLEREPDSDRTDTRDQLVKQAARQKQSVFSPVSELSGYLFDPPLE